MSAIPDIASLPRGGPAAFFRAGLTLDETGFGQYLWSVPLSSTFTTVISKGISPPQYQAMFPFALAVVANEQSEIYTNTPSLGTEGQVSD